ncbi:MAG: helix-hairpin-helix domain-containing protein [Flavobacteriales bacterium]|nr:helix-hairpin-helix domain-containing protein [Flavobacteriales bacterium]MCB9447448.1 helix-hairpin-helix domain-containing protein [Flavobacteriales bacterium]
MKERWLEWLTYSRNEQRGVLALVSLILSLAAVNMLWQPDKPSDVPALSTTMEAKDTDTVERYAPEIVPEVFDPNTVTEKELERMGVKGRLLKQWVAYVAHGGRFRQASDLKKLYAMDDHTFGRLLPFVQIRVQTPLNKNLHKEPVREKPLRSTHHVMLDVNQAERQEWITLPGIGEKLSTRIIKYRDLLGGFYSTDQLLEVYGIDSVTWQGMLPFLTIVDTHLVRINLNTAGFRTLLHHPYLTYDLVKDIVNARRRSPFNEISDLLTRKLVTRELYPKIAPYLNVQHGTKD